MATAFFALLSFPLYYFGYLPLKAWLALPLGHLVACFSDTFTKQGVQLFFPNPVWCVCGSNPNRRLTTGSPAEYWVLAGAVALFIVNIKLTSGGGLVQREKIPRLTRINGLITSFGSIILMSFFWILITLFTLQTNNSGQLIAKVILIVVLVVIILIPFRPLSKEFINKKSQKIKKDNEEVKIEKMYVLTVYLVSLYIASCMLGFYIQTNHPIIHIWILFIMITLLFFLLGVAWLLLLILG